MTEISIQFRYVLVHDNRLILPAFRAAAFLVSPATLLFFGAFALLIFPLAAFPLLSVTFMASAFFCALLLALVPLTITFVVVVPAHFFIVAGVIAPVSAIVGHNICLSVN
jgi:hypothetical protein